MKAVIFDMDGVIVDSEIHWKEVESDFLQQLIPTWDEELQESILGMSLYDIYDRLVSEFGLGLNKEEFLTRYRGLAAKIYGEQSNLLPGVESLIERFKEGGTPLAVASSSPRDWVKMTVQRFGFKPHFNAIISSDDVGGKGKPAPDIYLHAAEQLAVSPVNCIAIEDTDKGILSAKTAGMKCIGYRNGFNDGQSLGEADLVIDDFFALETDTVLKLVSS